MKKLQMIFILTLLLSLVMASTALAAQVTLLSNLSDTGSGAASDLSTQSKAVVFDTPASGYDFKGVTLYLNISTTFNGRIAIYDVDGSNNPANELYGWDVSQASAGLTDYTFMAPANKQFAASTRYALVIIGDASSATWNAGSSPTAPTGLATFVTYKISHDGGSSWSNSSVYNRFALLGDDVPTAIEVQSFAASNRSGGLATGGLVLALVAVSSLWVLRRKETH